MTEPLGDTPVDPTEDPAAETPAATPPTYQAPTKDELDRMLAAARKRERDRYADYEDLKARAAKLDEIEESNKSELEKALARAEAAEKFSESTVNEARAIKLRSAILSEAAKPDRRVVDPDLVATLLGPDIELDKDGNPTNVAKAMDSLLEARPYLVASNGGTRGSADQGARTGGANQLSEADLSSMTPEQIVKARKDGRLTDLGVAS